MFRCSGKFITNLFFFKKISNLISFSNFCLLSPQIGNRFALTAAHCLYDEDEEDEDRRELLPASSFSIMLGLHDRRNPKEPNRWQIHHKVRLHFVPGDKSGSARLLSMKTSLPLSMTLHCLNLVRRTFLVTQFMTNCQRTEWIYQSSALPVFLATVQALLARKGTSMVGSTNRYNKVSPLLCIRLGRHWNPRDLHRQAARDSGSHRPDQQLYGENEPERRCG